MNTTTMVAIALATVALCAGAETQTLESDALVVTADTATGAFSVRDKRSGREWGACYANGTDLGEWKEPRGRQNPETERDASHDIGFVAEDHVNRPG